MHVLRSVVRRAGAQELLVQLAVRSVPHVRRARHPAGGGRGAGGARRDALDQRGRARTVGEQHPRVLVPGARGRGRGPRLLPGHAMEEAPQAGARRGALRLGRGDLRPVPEPVRTPALVLHDLRGRAPQPRAALQGDGLRRLAGEARAVHARDPVPGVQGSAAPARDARGHGGWAEHLAADRPLDPEDPRVPRPDRALGAGGDDRRAAAEGDPREARVPRGRRPRLPDALAAGGDPRGRGGAADPAGDPDRLGAGGCPLHPGRAVDRAASAGQSSVAGHADPPPGSREHADRRRARRGDDHGGGPHRRHRAGSGGARRSDRLFGRPQGIARRGRVAHGRVPLGQAVDPGARRRGASPIDGFASRACVSTT